MRATVSFCLAGLCVALALAGCGGSHRERSLQPSDLGGCIISAYVRDNVTSRQVDALRRLLEADDNVGAFEFRSKQELLRETYPPLRKKLKPPHAYFTIVQARADTDSAERLEATLRTQPSITNLKVDGCPLLAREGGSTTYSRADVVKAFAAHGFALSPFKPPAGSPTSLTLTSQVLLVPPRPALFFVFVASSPQEAHSAYAEYTKQSAVGTVDLRLGNVLVSSVGDLARDEVARIEAALRSLS